MRNPAWIRWILQLNTNLLILRMSKLDNLCESRDLGIEPDARILWRNSTASLNGRSLHDEQTRATSDDPAHVRRSIPRLLEAINARVLAQRRDKDAVLEGYTSDRERREELGNGVPVGLRVDCGSCWRVLSWGEEGNPFCRLHVCGGLLGALARRHNGLGDWHHNLRVRHSGSLFLGQSLEEIIRLE